MHAHTHLSHYTYPYRYICILHTYIFMHRHTYIHETRLSHAQLYLRTWTPAHARAHTSPHYTRARSSAVPPRTTARGAPTTRRARPACGGAPLGPEKAAHTWDNEVTRAVFHAPMFALNADAELNACAPKPHAVDADGQGSHGFGFRL